MDEETLSLLSTLTSDSYVRHASAALNSQSKAVKALISSRQLPSVGWENINIISLLHTLSAMDTNNFNGNVGVGEREARVYSDIVKARHYNLGHGIGRSGDIAALQPKAVGSAAIYRIATFLVKNAMRRCGLRVQVLLLPVATGMTLSLVMKTLKQQRPGAEYVLWPRIDQKTCFKSIFSVGCTPKIISNRIEGDSVVTDMEALRTEVRSCDASRYLCVLSVTSAFAPRAPDDIVGIAKLCKEMDIPHIVNNAYGLQSAHICKTLKKAMDVGRIDAIIQSTDKNFMVPVGGGIVACPGTSKLIQAVSEAYPGRASMSPVLDMFITLLRMGAAGWDELRATREELFVYLKTQLEIVARANGERLLDIPGNTISTAMTLRTFTLAEEDGKGEGATFLGSMLFQSNCSGARAVSGKLRKSIEGEVFEGYGSHVDCYMFPYLACSCAIGTRKEDIDIFIQRLTKCISKFRKIQNRIGIHTDPCPCCLLKSRIALFVWNCAATALRFSSVSRASLLKNPVAFRAVMLRSNLHSSVRQTLHFRANAGNDTFRWLFAAIGGSLFAGSLLFTNSEAERMKTDIQAVRNAIMKKLEDNEDMGPTLVRLAWHASGTYCRYTKTGGSEGATQRFSPECDFGANAGLNLARDFLESVKRDYPTISYSDLWTLAGVVAIEYMGGPVIGWREGREDYNSGVHCPPDGRLPDADKGDKAATIQHVRDIFYRMGFNDREIVALLGCHAIGRCHKEASGYDGPWTRAPTTFSNEYYRELLENQWTLRKWDGPAQYQDPSNELMMLHADMALVWDPTFREYVKEYKDNEEQWFADFAKAFQKLEEFGVKKFEKKGWFF